MSDRNHIAKSNQTPSENGKLRTLCGLMESFEEPMDNTKVFCPVCVSGMFQVHQEMLKVLNSYVRFVAIIADSTAGFEREMGVSLGLINDEPPATPEEEETFPPDPQR